MNSSFCDFGKHGAFHYMLKSEGGLPPKDFRLTLLTWIPVKGFGSSEFLSEVDFD